MDSVHHMDKQVVHEVLSSDSKVFVTTQPIYCGQSEYEWDAPLIRDTVRSFMRRKVFYEFNLSKDYKPEIVNVITGYRVKDNPWLSKMYVW